MFKLAELFVDIRARDDALKQQVGALHGQLSAVGVAIGTAVGNFVSSSIARATSALAGFFSSGIRGAVELQDVLSATSAIFGDSASVITKRADELAAEFGTVKTEYVQAAQSLGAAFKGAGTPVAEAAALGNQLAKLGMDLASFKGGTTSNADAFTALQAALRGDYEQLERFNVFMTAAVVTEEAVSLGLAKNAKDMDEAARKQAALSLIMKKTIDQQGDLERTSDQTHNTWAKFTGTMTNLATSIGDSLMPAIQSVAGGLAQMATGLAAAFEASRGSFESLASGVVAAVDTIGVAWRNLPDIWEIVQIKFREMFTNMVAALAVLPENLARIGSWFAENWVDLMYDGIAAVMVMFENLGENIRRIGVGVAEWLSNPLGGYHVDYKDLFEGFEAQAQALPELVKPAFVSLEGEMDAVGDRMASREAKRAADVAKAAAAPAKEAAAVAGKKAEEFKSKTSGLADFRSDLIERALGRGEDIPKKQLDEQQKTRMAAEKTADLLTDFRPAAVLG